MKVGERVRHRSCPADGIGTILAIHDGGDCDVHFDSGDYTGVSVNNFESVEAEEAIRALDGLLAREALDEARQFYERRCQPYLSHIEFEKLLRYAEARRARRLTTEAAAQAAERRRDLREQVRHFLVRRDVDAADRLYASSCSSWWPAADYAAECTRFSKAGAIADAIACGTLADVWEKYLLGGRAQTPLNIAAKLMTSASSGGNATPHSLRRTRECCAVDARRSRHNSKCYWKLLVSPA